jgi:hypothetical protein
MEILEFQVKSSAFKVTKVFPKKAWNSLKCFPNEKENQEKIMLHMSHERKIHSFQGKMRLWSCEG